MRLLLDTNVLLDVLLDRTPFAGPARRVLQLVEQRAVVGVVCATSVTTIHYLIARHRDVRTAEDSVRRLLEILDVAAADRHVLLEACGATGPDFEDRVVAEAGKAVGIDAIVTRDARGFAASGSVVLSPAEFVAALDRD